VSYVFFPVKVEIMDSSTNDVAAVVEMQDEGAAFVEMKTATNAGDWTALSGAIRQALLSMKLTGDETE